jgi:hypothetical protein
MQEDVQSQIDQSLPAGGEISQSALRAFWDSIGLQAEDSGYLVFEDAFLVQVRTSEPETLYFRPGGWIAKASGPAIKTAVVSALLALALAGSQATGIPVLVIPAVVPLLFDLEKVRLTRSEEHILAELTLRSDVRASTAEALYNTLPDSVKEQMAPLAFRDFLEKCRVAGLADLQEEPLSLVQESRYVLRPPGSERFRVTFS